MATVGLAEVLAALREELAAAQEAGAGNQSAFEITEAEVEFLVEVDAGGVVSLKPGGAVSRGDTYRLRLKLNIKDAATGRNREVRRDQVRSWDEGDNAVSRSWDEGDKPRG